MRILGYKIQDKQYVIDEDNALIVKKIFQLYISGKTNNNNIKTALGNEFNKNSIHRINILEFLHIKESKS